MWPQPEACLCWSLESTINWGWRWGWVDAMQNKARLQLGLQAARLSLAIWCFLDRLEAGPGPKLITKTGLYTTTTNFWLVERVTNVTRCPILLCDVAMLHLVASMTFIVEWIGFAINQHMSQTRSCWVFVATPSARDALLSFLLAADFQLVCQPVPTLVNVSC